MTKENEGQLRDEIAEMKKEIMKCKETKIALKKSEERFRSFSESANDGIVTTDDNGNILFFNKIIKTQFGYSTDELSGKNLTMLMPEKFRNSYLKELQEYKTSQKHRLLGKTVQTTGLKKDGTTFPFEMSLSVWKSDKTTYFSAIIRDITERKKAEEALRESEEKYRSVVENMHDVFYRADMEGNITMISSSGPKMSGYESVDDMIGLNLSRDLYKKPEERDILLSTIKKEEKVTDYEIELKKKDGNSLWVSSNSHIYYDNSKKPLGVEGVFKDINERKKAEEVRKKNEKKYRGIVEKVKKSEQRFRIIAETATDGIVTSDVHGNILFFNKSVKTMFGYSADEMEGKPLTMLMPNRFKAGYIEYLEKFRSGGEHELIGKTIETIGLKKDGTEFPFEMSLSTWKSVDKTYFSAILRDITERKKAEEKRKKTEEKYRYIVEKFLKVSNEILQEMNKP